MPNKNISHALRLPAPVGDVYTKCGMKLRAGLSKRHSIAMNQAAATCVPCSAVAVAELQVKRVERGQINPAHAAYYDWADGPDAGISSKTIVRAITGASVIRWRMEGVPLDPSDFGRCVRVLERFPELKPQLHVVAEKYPEWRGLVDAWPELEALYAEELPTGKAPKLYARMQALLEEHRNV